MFHRKDICWGGTEVSLHLNCVLFSWSGKFFKWNYSFGQIAGLLSAALDENEHGGIMDVICKGKLIVEYREWLSFKIEEQQQQHNLCSQGGITIMTDYNLLMRNFYNGCWIVTREHFLGCNDGGFQQCNSTFWRVNLSGKCITLNLNYDDFLFVKNHAGAIRLHDGF